MTDSRQRIKVGEEAIFLPNPYNVIYKADNEEILRKVSQDIPLDELKSPKMQLFFDQLYDAMLAEDLPKGWMHAGISAIQVGEPLNAFYAYDSNHDDYELFINPKVELLGDSTWTKDESCLSIPEVIGSVRRHKRLRIIYYNRLGEKVRFKASGWNAKVIQHEYDHLQGVLFTDKIIE